jgi:alkanesulfonate monooxygenase SsuD/methylene tetrahydromethanopterin reductase-like flavin-dependent oxidoreductase (luciferase family)
MKFSLFNLMMQRDKSATPQQILQDTIAMVKLADEIGFDAAWFAEHHFSNYSICPSPAMMAAHCAGVTRRIRLGAAVHVLPLYNPVRLVQELALLDLQSGGRSVIGIGSGYQKYEFDRFHRDLSQRTAISMEAWDILEMGLRDGYLGYSGKYFQVPESPLSLRPLQSPMPQFFVTGLEPAVVQRTARSGHIPFITAGWRGFSLLKEMQAHVQKQYAAAGVPLVRMPLAVQQYVYVTSDKNEALDIAERARSVARLVTTTRTGTPQLSGHFIQEVPMPNEPSIETFLDNLVIGDPHYVAEKLVGEITALSITHLSCFMQIGTVEGRRALRSLDRFASETVPLMENAFGMPLDQVHAERMPAPPRLLAPGEDRTGPQPSERRYALGQ